MFTWSLQSCAWTATDITPFTFSPFLMLYEFLAVKLASLLFSLESKFKPSSQWLGRLQLLVNILLRLIRPQNPHQIWTLKVGMTTKGTFYVETSKLILLFGQWALQAYLICKRLKQPYELFPFTYASSFHPPFLYWMSYITRVRWAFQLTRF